METLSHVQKRFRQLLRQTKLLEVIVCYSLSHFQPTALSPTAWEHLSADMLVSYQEARL